MDKKRGLYIVSESATLIKGSGAYRHIEVGRTYLSKHFDIHFYPLCEVPKIQASTAVDNSNTLEKPSKKTEHWLKTMLKNIGFWHSIKDLKILLVNHRNIFKEYKAIKALNPDFIYERSNFLNFNALIISKWLNIPHFYENNGIKYLEQKEQVKSWFNWLWAVFERTAYKKSDFVFFVGLWGSRMNLTTNNWINIENGIEQNYLYQFKEHNKDVNEVINICFIGSLMKHHGFQLLIDALKGMDTSNIHLHLFGSKLDIVLEKLNDFVLTTYHGFLDRTELALALENMHIGVIPNARHYQSQMKLFDYGASKCLVIAPNLKNLEYWFSKNQIEFFEKDNMNSLQTSLVKVISNKNMIKNKGNSIYNFIEKTFTWDKIFEKKANIIQQTILNNEKNK